MPPSALSPDPLRLLASRLLEQLRAEEQLLRDAHATLTEVHAALRRGDLTAVTGTHPRQEAVAAALAARPSAASATALAAAVGLPAAGLTLAALADRLPDPLAADLRAARDRLRAAADDLTAVHARNANLVGHLRSYFRGVLADLTAADAPARYGRSGERLGGPAGGAIQARG